MRYRAVTGLMLVLISLLAACQTAREVTPSPQDLVQWNKDPYAVVFRAEIVGGDDEAAFYKLNDIPACTIYGDGHMIWIIDGPNGTRQMLLDYLSADDLSRFIVDLGLGRKFYTYTEGFPLQIPSASKPVYERMSLENNGVKYVSDSFSNWPFDYYNDTLQFCMAQAKTPRTFAPDNAWLSAQQFDYDQRIPSIFWDPQAAGRSFVELAATKERVWIEGALVKILWQALEDRGRDTQFEENGNYYRIALQIPGVTRDAPPAPAAQPAP